MVLQPVTLGYRITIFFLEEIRGARYVRLGRRISRYTKALSHLCMSRCFIDRVDSRTTDAAHQQNMEFCGTGAG